MRSISLPFLAALISLSRGSRRSGVVHTDHLGNIPFDAGNDPPPFPPEHLDNRRPRSRHLDPLNNCSFCRSLIHIMT